MSPADPLIDLGAYRVRLSAIRQSRRSREVYLRAPFEQRRHVRCLCLPQGVQMGVACRLEAGPTYYLYHLHRPDPMAHAERCPHRINSDPAINLPPFTPPACLVTAKALDFSPVRTSSDAACTPSIDSLPILLETLLYKAGLNVWKPTFAGHRRYSQVRYRIIEAAKGIALKRCGNLADRLFMPPKWSPKEAESNLLEWKLFLDQITPHDHDTPKGLVIGLVKSITTKEGWRAPVLRLSEWAEPFWLDSVPQLIDGDAADVRWFAILAIERSRRGTPRVVDGAATRVSREWIPVMSDAHARLADQWVDGGRAFSAPLSVDKRTAWSMPDLIELPTTITTHKDHAAVGHLQAHCDN